MGYYMDNIGCDFTIKSENKLKALNLLKELATNNKNLSWINSDDVINSASLSEAISECGWEIEEDDNGNVIYIYFSSEKLGDEYIIFKAIAPAVENDSYIEMSGEDGDRWRWVFKNEDCKEINAKIVWE